MTEIYLHFQFAHYGLYANVPVCRRVVSIQNEQKRKLLEERQRAQQQREEAQLISAREMEHKLRQGELGECTGG